MASDDERERDARLHDRLARLGHLIGRSRLLTASPYAMRSGAAQSSMVTDSRTGIAVASASFQRVTHPPTRIASRAAVRHASSTARLRTGSRRVGERAGPVKVRPSCAQFGEAPPRPCKDSRTDVLRAGPRSRTQHDLGVAAHVPVSVPGELAGAWPLDHRQGVRRCRTIAARGGAAEGSGRAVRPTRAVVQSWTRGLVDHEGA